jgi:N-methylhydantoinase B
VADLPGTFELTSINTSHGPFPADSVEYHNWQGGGGYGDPLDRDPQRVLADLLDQRVSSACARQLYGVVTAAAVSGGGIEVDLAATSQARQAERRRRLASGRPARDLLPAPSAEWRERTSFVTGQQASGTLRIGAEILLDFGAGRASCAECGTALGEAHGDPRLGCLAELTGTGAAGPVRGQDYGSANVVLARYYCPGCGRQLDAGVLYADLSRHHGYLPAAAVAGPPVPPIAGPPPAQLPVPPPAGPAR